ncbi:MAG: DnaD domain protein [Clostridia bacterium]|nr:DnaD domain protein [Clostridia bacterium]
MSEWILKIVPNYENSVAVIPARVIECLNDATGNDMAVLIAALRDGTGFDPDAVCRELGITKKTLDSALSFWEKNGILTVEGTKGSGRSVPLGKKNRKADPEVSVKSSDPRPQRTEVPPLTTEEAARFLEGNKKARLLIKDIEKSFGKILSRAEVNTVIGLIDHLSLSPEYIMLLVAHAKEREKNSVRYVEKLAIDLFDNGITSYSALVEEMTAVEAAESFEGVVRKIFGLGKRALTKKEKTMIKAWCSDWGYGEDMVTEAYEITVNSTNEPSLPYANAILEKWHSLGFKTVDEARAYQKEHSAGTKKNKAGSKSASSFDTDDFFEAALKRSYDKK